ncbi:MAG: Asp-tRNA(Asn)/Glu-tRNA(Gln) amidotransferase subunit GatC [Rickettsiales bacterium]|nr:Asp-tRNA(Asn)/Glu-tRNA(Gln) amidotransferase subunit GatC [Rickettsiales bacterium]
MSVTKEDIKKVSRLARIKIADDQINDVANKINGIIDWVEKLAEVDTDNVEILTNVHGENLRLQKDEVSEGNIAEDVLANSKHAKYGYFSVPKVLQ